MPETPRSYLDKLEVKPLERPPVATARVPGSKSITNRALVLAVQKQDDDRMVCLNGVLASEDTEVMIDSLRRLGFSIEAKAPDKLIVSNESSQAIPAATADLFVGNSGTSMRFLTALVSTGCGRYRIDGVPRMRERPIEDLLSSLRQLGVNARSENRNGCPPVIVETRGLRGGHVSIKGSTSSQYLSALLMAAASAENRVVIDLDGDLVSEPYIEMTVKMMRQFGMSVEHPSPQQYVVDPSAGDCDLDYRIEPDASAASYFFAAAAIGRGTVTVVDVLRDSLQGDVAFADVLARMGCHVKEGSFGIAVQGRLFRGIDVDMNAISDTVMTLAAVACFADGPTTIRNVAHIRHKETDRLAALATELRRVGAEVEEFADGLTITPRPLHGAEIETYNDHRMAMSMALIGLRVPGIVIKDPGCVAKTYPGFWEDLEKLRQ